MRYLRIFSCIALCFTVMQCQNIDKENFSLPKTLYETSKGIETDTYEAVIDFYQKAAKHPKVQIATFGNTDAGYPLHVVSYNTKGKYRVLINNAIHPGESDGVDASMLLLKKLLSSDSLSRAFKDLAIHIIPVYNIGGYRNRIQPTRANQNGPLHHGFRGNAQNYDLNRDFIKNDTDNSFAFMQIYHEVQPDVFIDTHVSNGADYQYTLTHLITQKEKLSGKLGIFLEQKYKPILEQNLYNLGWDITPYVNVYGAPPNKGFAQFMDHPRYSTGYTSLFHSLGIMLETHMLKAYKNRVKGSLDFLVSNLQTTQKYGSKIQELREDSEKYWKNKRYYPTKWELDKTIADTLEFKGFAYTWEASAITDGKRLRYDNTKKETFPVPFYNRYKATDSVSIPKAYIIPQQWHKVVKRLRANKIILNPLTKDTLIKVNSYKILDYKTNDNPYEGHYTHSNTQVLKQQETISFNKGDFLVPTDQNGIRYIIETLEPTTNDSFFNWNFFDTILQRKEGFSTYVFEEEAISILKNDSIIRKAFNTFKETNNSRYAQLNFIYERSKFKEKAHLRYPIFRIE